MILLKLSCWRYFLYDVVMVSHLDYTPTEKLNAFFCLKKRSSCQTLRQLRRHFIYAYVFLWLWLSAMPWTNELELVWVEITNREQKKAFIFVKQKHLNNFWIQIFSLSLETEIGFHKIFFLRSYLFSHYVYVSKDKSLR